MTALYIPAIQAPGGAPPARRAVAVAAIIAREAEEGERQGHLTDDAQAALVDAGLYRLLMAREAGGEEVSPVEFMEALEILAKADAAAAWCICQTSVCSTASAQLDPDVGAEIFAPRHAVLASGVGVGRAVRQADGSFRLSGRWDFGSGSHHATWLAGAADLVDGEGHPIPNAAGAPDRAQLLFPAARAQMLETWQVIGLKATGSNSYTVEDLPVPASHMFRFGAPRAPHCAGPLYVMSPDSLWGGGFGALALGLAAAMRAELLALALKKTARGAESAMAQAPAIQALLARSAAQLGAARLFLFETMAAVWSEIRASDSMSLDQRVRVRLAGSHAIETARIVADEVYHAAGTTAIFAGNGFERRFRDMHTVAQHLHGREAHFETVGQFMLGQTLRSGFL